MPMEEHTQCPDVSSDGLNTKNQMTKTFIYNQQLLDKLELDGPPRLVKLCASFQNCVIPVLNSSVHFLPLKCILGYGMGN